MKQAVKSLIKSPAAFVIVLLIIVLVFIFIARATTGSNNEGADETMTSATHVVTYFLL